MPPNTCGNSCPLPSKREGGGGGGGGERNFHFGVHATGGVGCVHV